MNTFEVEMKFPVQDAQAFLRAVGALGAQPGPSLEESDLYLAHPSRDFSATDEALRIRRCKGKDLKGAQDRQDDQNPARAGVCCPGRRRRDGA
jgi:adenylate cyclase class IV